MAYSADGQQWWAATWGGPAGREGIPDDGTESVAVDPGSHRVFVTATGGSHLGRVVTIAYDADGRQRWVDHGAFGSVAGAVRSVAVDPGTHASYVTGYSGDAVATSCSGATPG